MTYIWCTKSAKHDHWFRAICNWRWRCYVVIFNVLASKFNLSVQSALFSVEFCHISTFAIPWKSTNMAAFRVQLFVWKAFNIHHLGFYIYTLDIWADFTIKCSMNLDTHNLEGTGLIKGYRVTSASPDAVFCFFFFFCLHLAVRSGSTFLDACWNRKKFVIDKYLIVHL